MGGNLYVFTYEMTKICRLNHEEANFDPRSNSDLLANVSESNNITSIIKCKVLVHFVESLDLLSAF